MAMTEEERIAFNAKVKKRRDERKARGVCIQCGKGKPEHYALLCDVCGRRYTKLCRERNWAKKMDKEIGTEVSTSASKKAQKAIDERINPTFIGKTNLSKKMMSEEIARCRIVWANSLPEVEALINEVIERGIVSGVQDIKFFETRGQFVACILLTEYCGVKSKI